MFLVLLVVVAFLIALYPLLSWNTVTLHDCRHGGDLNFVETISGPKVSFVQWVGVVIQHASPN